MTYEKMASFYCQVQVIWILNFILKAKGEGTHVFIKDSKYQTFVHNLKEEYFLDKGEAIHVWAKVIPFPWQDNRLIAGISAPTLLEFNASCKEEVVSKGVIARNMTTQVSQVRNETNKHRLLQDKTGNATFFMEIFSEMENVEEPIRVETEINVGCPTERIMTAHRNVSDCSLIRNYTSIIPSGQYYTNFSSKQTQGNGNKLVHYNFSTLGCPIDVNYYDYFKPTLDLYEGGAFLKEVTANYVLYELHGRTDYSFTATMAQVRCLREAQSWRKFNSTDGADISKSWTRQNYKSCFVSEGDENPNLNQPYEILNKSGLSAIAWQDEGIYVFRVTVIDPDYSFCNLTTMFAVRVSGVDSEPEELVSFLVLGTSVLGLLSIVIFLYYTNKYYNRVE